MLKAYRLYQQRKVAVPVLRECRRSRWPRSGACSSYRNKLLGKPYNSAWHGFEHGSLLWRTPATGFASSGRRGQESGIAGAEFPPAQGMAPLPGAAGPASKGIAPSSSACAASLMPVSQHAATASVPAFSSEANRATMDGLTAGAGAAAAAPPRRRSTTARHPPRRCGPSHWRPCPLAGSTPQCR